MKIVVLGLTVTSSWGNGHATTYRALLKALARRRHAICFVEKDVEWYRNHRDLPQPDFCKLLLYQNWKEVRRRVLREAAFADVVVVGSTFPMQLLPRTSCSSMAGLLLSSTISTLR